MFTLDLMSQNKDCWSGHWAVWVGPFLGALFAALFYGAHNKLGTKVAPA